MSTFDSSHHQPTSSSLFPPPFDTHLIETSIIKGFSEIDCRNKYEDVTKFKKINDDDNDEDMVCANCNKLRWLHQSSTPVCGEFYPSTNDNYKQFCNNNPEGYCKACLGGYRVCRVGKHINLSLQTQIVVSPDNKRKHYFQENNIFKKILNLFSSFNFFSECNSYETIGEKVGFGYLYDFLKALLIEDNINRSGRLWTFKDRTSWLSGNVTIEHFLNREYYDILMDELEKNSMNDSVHIVEGTPGIGKSVFLNRVFLFIVESYRKSNDTKPIQIVYQIMYPSNNPLATMTRFNLIILYKSYGNLRFHLYTLPYDINYYALRCDYNILDTFSPPFRISSKFTFYVGPTNHINKAPTHLGNVKIRTFMPIFSFEELNLISPSTWNEEQKKFRFSVLGGCARNYLSNDCSKYIDENVFKALKLFSPTEFSSENNEENFLHFKILCGILTNALQSITSNQFNMKNYNLFNRTTVHYIRDKNDRTNDILNAIYKPQWSSVVIMNVVGHLDENTNSRIWDNNLRNLLSGSISGGLFESYVHYQIISIKPKLKFKCIPNGNEDCYTDIYFNNISNVKYLWDYSAVEELNDNEYGLPLKQNYDAVDAIIQPNILIQIIKREEHPIDLNTLNYSRQFLKGEQNTHILLYIIYKDVISFKINNFTQSTRSTARYPTDIKQYVGYIGVTSDLLEKLAIIN